MEKTHTINQLSLAVSLLAKKLENIEHLLTEKSEQSPTEQAEQLLTIKEAAVLLNLSVSTLYRKVSNSEISYYKFNNRIYFTLNELLRYRKSKHNLTIVKPNDNSCNLFKRLIKWLSKNKDLIKVIVTIVKNLL